MNKAHRNAWLDSMLERKQPMTTLPPVGHGTATRRTFWAVAVFYLLIGFEFLYMASPFAMYFYSVYAPGLTFMQQNPVLAWLNSTFLPHIVAETASPILNLHNVIGAVLAVAGFLAFCVGATQVYYHKLARKGAVTGGIYQVIRHPQYAALILCSFGLLLVWPRFIVLLSFLAMLFVYYFLARLEEHECEQKFGQSYLEYKRTTQMFVPVRIPLVDRLPRLPRRGLARILGILCLYVLTAAAVVGMALGIRTWALNSIAGVYTDHAAYVSVAYLDDQTLKQAIEIALADPQVQAQLATTQPTPDAPWLNYILPTDWYVAEIPMNQPAGAERGHYTPTPYDATQIRIVFTQATLSAGQQAEGRDILLSTPQRVPLGEAVVDLAQGTVIDLVAPSETIMYDNIPVPVY